MEISTLNKEQITNLSLGDSSLRTHSLYIMHYKSTICIFNSVNFFITIYISITQWGNSRFGWVKRLKGKRLYNREIRILVQY